MSSTPMDWPTWCVPERIELALSRPSSQHRSEITKLGQAVFRGVEFWTMTIYFPAENGQGDAGRREALMNLLAGGDQVLRAYHFARPVPKGTMRGAPLLAAGVSQFAREISLSGAYAVGGAPGTLETGDMLSLNDQLLQVASPCTADGSGNMVVPLVNRVRRSVAAGAAVGWDAPTAAFYLPDESTKSSYASNILAATSVTLLEWV